MNMTELPMRVLDVGTRDQPHVRLVLIESIDQKTALKYVALSHCWGVGASLVRTTTNNISQHLKDIAWGEFSKTFQDAICITRGLDVRYLWIDSVCIIQDSMLDWASESKRMGGIYSNAHLTISATGSSDGSGGCLFPRWVKGPGATRRARQTIPILSETRGGSLFEVHARLTREAAHEQFISNGENLPRMTAPLMSRAWCFQERMLSMRVLHFHSEEVVWECATSTACECGFLKGSRGQDQMPFKDKSYRLQASQVFQGLRAKEEVFNTWRGVVTQYSGLLLTRESDRLPALAGLAQRFQTAVGCPYLAGLWGDDLLRALLWRRPVVGSTRRRVQSTGCKFPTWSWASVEHINSEEEEGASGIYYPPALDSDIDSQVEVLAISGLGSGETSTLTVSDASITLRGVCTSTPVLERDYENGVEIQYDVDEEKPTGMVTCLLVACIKGNFQCGFLYFLILVRLPSGKFDRVGCGHLEPGRGRNWFENASLMKVEIV